MVSIACATCRYGESSVSTLESRHRWSRAAWQPNKHDALQASPSAAARGVLYREGAAGQGPPEPDGEVC